MVDLIFEKILSAKKEKILELFQKYEEYKDYFPHQLKNIELLEKIENGFLLKETFQFSTILKNTIEFESKHIVKDDKIFIEIISGPAKNSKAEITLIDYAQDTKINIVIDLKTEMKFKIFLPLIKKTYKKILTTILLKMNTKAMN